MTDKITKEYKPEKIILFGSLVWGKPHKDSDIDLFIVKKTKKRRLDREREVAKILFFLIFHATDIIVYTPTEVERRLKIEDFFVKDIFHKGKLLYAK